MQKLPVDISTFSRIRQSNYLYVDKTEHIYRMITEGHRYFLSRPRRFGKSLLISTLQEILTANKSLFNGLWIGNSDYQWQEYGVISLDFSKLKASDPITLKNRLCNTLETVAQGYNLAIDTKENAPDLMLQKLVLALSQRFGKVAILIDEYDSPILKSLDNETVAQEVRQEIQHFFTVIKSLDAYVQFAFITGVSSFAKAGLFSGINNLQILTLRNDYATICGYTDQEIDFYFSDYITKWAAKENVSYDNLRQKIKTWYNGYHFGKDVAAVYNPFSVMNALNISEFENFWFQSGTPTFLVDQLKKERNIIDLEDPQASQDFLGIFDVGNIPPVSLMFQAGYLTITGYDPESRLYSLDYPNTEVRVAFQKYLLEVCADIRASDAERLSGDFRTALNNENIERVVEIIQQLFAHVPYQLQMKQEKYYHSLFMMVCVGTGIKAQAEYSTSHGRIDLVLELPKIFYVIEVKFNKPAEEALAQIEERRYYERFISQTKPIVLLGLAFRREPHTFDVAYAVKKYNLSEK